MYRGNEIFVVGFAQVYVNYVRNGCVMDGESLEQVFLSSWEISGFLNFRGELI